MSTPSFGIPVTAGSMTGFASGCSVPNTRTEGVGTKHHRIAEVRRVQSVSLATCARKLGITVAEARHQEQPTTDLSISQLMAWKRVLDVPLMELIGPIEDELENPIRNRALLLKVMKTAKQIKQIATEERVLFAAENLVSQLVDLMPELKDVNAWPDVGQSHEPRSPWLSYDYGQFSPATARLFER